MVTGVEAASSFTRREVTPEPTKTWSPELAAQVPTPRCPCGTRVSATCSIAPPPTTPFRSTAGARSPVERATSGARCCSTRRPSAVRRSGVDGRMPSLIAASRPDPDATRATSVSSRHQPSTATRPNTWSPRTSASSSPIHCSADCTSTPSGHEGCVVGQPRVYSGWRERTAPTRAVTGTGSAPTSWRAPATVDERRRPAAAATSHLPVGRPSSSRAHAVSIPGGPRGGGSRPQAQSWPSSASSASSTVPS
jgi:hypothetical protein